MWELEAEATLRSEDPELGLRCRTGTVATLEPCRTPCFGCKGAVCPGLLGGVTGPPGWQLGPPYNVASEQVEGSHRGRGSWGGSRAPKKKEFFLFIFLFGNTHSLELVALLCLLGSASRWICWLKLRVPAGSVP